mmetsp:Transcript_43386/g.134805  ORF Transcript_43386/g.134805 Transcript_43386/m.134805 type:complete len:200 (-) Transcript_43386:754-1353(-)
MLVLVSPAACVLTGSAANNISSGKSSKPTLRTGSLSAASANPSISSITASTVVFNLATRLLARSASLSSALRLSSSELALAISTFRFFSLAFTSARAALASLASPPAAANFSMASSRACSCSSKLSSKSSNWSLASSSAFIAFRTSAKRMSMSSASPTIWLLKTARLFASETQASMLAVAVLTHSSFSRMCWRPAARRT